MVTWGLLASGFCLALTSSTSCTARDCAEERAGQVRCVANRSELCNADGTLTYTSCTAMGLFCSEDKGGCVTEDILNSTGGGGAGGDGGSGTGGDPSTTTTTTTGAGGMTSGAGGMGTGGTTGGAGGIGGAGGN